MCTPSQPEPRSPFVWSRRGRWLLPALLLALCGLWLATPQTAHAQAVILVDADAPGPLHDGLSWTTAYTNVQDALDLTNANGAVSYEIWVAEGVYYPDEGGGHVDNAVSESFRINWDNVQLYGGFGGYGIDETLRTQRDWVAYPTILSGDIDGDTTLEGNAYHVVYLDGVSESISTATVLDGFTVSGGNANGTSADASGGGILCDGTSGQPCSPRLANLRISDNSAENGGGLYNNGSSGGASSPVLTDVLISGNRAGSGGGMYNDGMTGESSPVLTNVTISGNRATSDGGGLYNFGLWGASRPLLLNSIVWGNSGGSQIVNVVAATDVSYSNVQGGYAGTGNIDADPLFAAAMDGNSAPTMTGDYRLLPGSPSIDTGTDTGCPADDLDGRGRPIDGNGDGSAVCDMGAYETPQMPYLRVTKLVEPAAFAPGGMVTYTLMVSNVGAFADAAVLLTDTLPLSVTFGGWVQNDGGATETDGEIRWGGGLAVQAAQRFVFTATHTGGYNEVVTNTVQASGSQQMFSAEASFRTSPLIFVDKDMATSGDGRSWARAYKTVQEALDETNANGAVRYEVWVAEGSYYPDEGGGHVADDRSESFRISYDNVQIYGGFAATETLRMQRDWAAHPTILSGDIDGDGTLANNAYQVLHISGLNGGITSATLLDSFTVTGGNADGSDLQNSGGGVFCDGAGSLSNPLLKNVIISGNHADYYGGGMFNYGNDGESSPILADVIISNNSAQYGGGMYNDGVVDKSNPVLTNVLISGNSAEYGGGMYNAGPLGDSSPVLTNVLINGNRATNGGGMYNHGVIGNSSPLLTNVTISGNRAEGSGGGMYNDGSEGSSSPGLVNSIVWSNGATADGAQIYDVNAAPAVNHSNVQGGYAGTNNIEADPLFVAPITATLAPTTTGNYRLFFGSPSIDTGTNSGCPANDLDGLGRPIDGNGDGSAICDMGAYEMGPYLRVSKLATPAMVRPGGVVTYTLVLSNVGTLADAAVLLTDTLPLSVTFGGWVQQGGAAESGGQITWGGGLAVQAAQSIVFTATHTGGYNQVVTNMVRASGSLQTVSAEASFSTSQLIFVDKDRATSGDGRSWATAYKTVQEALDETNGNGALLYEVWVAEGVYYPDAGGGHVANAVSESFRIAWDNVQLYGGFAATETLRTQRNWTAHPTILSGDIDGDDTNTDGNFIAETWADLQGSNTRHVLWLDGVTNASLTGATVLDGFTVTGGSAYGSDSPDKEGGGLYCAGNASGRACSPTLRNLIVSGNQAYGQGPVRLGYGGGMYNSGASGGVSSPTLTNVIFRGNQASSEMSGGDGGGMYNNGVSGGVSSPVLTNVIFQGNSAAAYGGGMYNEGREGVSSPTLANVTFSGNRAIFGGGMYNGGNYGKSSPALTNVTFSGNSANFGGGIYGYAYLGVSSPTLENCVLWGNTASNSDAQIYSGENTAPVVRNSIVQGGYAGEGNLDADPRFAAPVAASSAPTADGDYRVQACSPAIDAGNNLIVTAATDLDGNPRIQARSVDMGAYESAPMACLGAAKQVTPTTDVAYQGVVTYTLILSNSGNLTETAILTDTLPAQVDFGAWVQNPGATVTDDAFAWTGAITPASVLTFTFTATHTHGVGAAITNTAFYSGALQSGSAAASFTALCGAHITVQTSGDSGAGSLRQAIADLCPGGVIDFAPILRDRTIPLSSQLAIAKSLTITGSVPVTVSGGGSVRIFAVNAGVQATLAGLTLDNGYAADTGGAIYNAGTLTVTHSGVYNSAAGNGGGLYNEGVLVVQASSLAGNTATDPIGGGGAIFNTGVLTLTDSRLAGNAGEFGAALVNLSGGGWVQRSTFVNNRANTAGAGIYTSAGILHITECTFTGNATGSDAGAYGGALVTDSSELFVARTTFANNRAFNGGGVYLMGDGVAAIHNSTLAGNLATNSGGGLYNESSAPVALVNNTITGNGAANSGGVQNYGTLSLTNTVIANSVTGGDCRNGDAANGFTIGVIAANAHNLFASTAITETCGIADGAGGSLTGVDPLLGALGDYGGNTQTIPLLPGSRAIDAGDAATCAAAPVAGVDQRGMARPQGAVCDLGAFESRGFSVAGSGGSGQSTPIGAAFAQPLTLTLTSAYTEPVGGGHVRFTPPAAGAGLNTADPFTLTTDAGGAVSTPVRANLITGSYTVTASVRGVLAPVSFRLTNTRLPVTVTVASAVNPSRYGEAVTFTATVQTLQAGDAIDSQKTQTGPTGAVTLTVDGSAIGTTQIDASGAAIFTYSSILSVGDHAVMAHYAGDETYLPQAAAPFTQTVSRATPTVAADHAPSPSRYGESVIFTATVRAPVINSNGVGGGLATPSGVVTFTAGATWLGAAPLDAAGVATYTTAGLVVGDHLVTAAYGGDGNYAPASAAPVTQTVIAAATVTGLTSAPNPSTFGQSVTFTATVTVNAPGAGTPSGVVTFTTTGGDLGTGTLTGGVAIFSTASLPVGSHVVTATYGGDGNFAGSIAAPVTQLVTPAPVTIQVGAEPAAGGAVTGGGVYAQNAVVTATATANAGYTFLHWAESGAPVTTTAIYPFTATADRALLAHFAPLPLARNDATGVLEGEAVTIAVLANDINPAGGGLIVVAVSQPAHGAASINPDNATVQYAAAAGVGGLDSFTYTLRDANGQQSTATVAVVVTILPETDVAPQVLVVDPTQPHTIPFTSTQATVTADVPAGVYTGALTLRQIFFLSYTPIVTPTVHTFTPPGTLHFGGFEFDLAVFIDDVPQPGFRFVQPVTLTIRYDPALLLSLDPATLGLYIWDGAGWSTDGIAILSHDPATATLTVAITRLGEFAFFAAAAPTNLDPAPEPETQAALLYLPAVMR